MIALIAAYAKNRVIGNNGRIPWKIAGEQKRFQALTTGNVVVMGRHTFEEIGKPLPNRTTIVVSSTQTFIGENCHTVTSLQDAISLAGNRDIFISGGVRLYEEALPMAEKLYLTEIEAIIDGDTYFPIFREAAFQKVFHQNCDGEIPYAYMTYVRKPEREIDRRDRYGNES